MTVLMTGLLSRVPDHGAGHAVAAAAAAAELRAGDRADLDARLLQLPDRGLVALVPDDHARAERDHVVPVVPLLALGLELVAAGGDDLPALDAALVLDDVEERVLADLGLDAAVAVRREHDRQDLLDDRLVDRDHVAVAEGEDRVEVHGGA